MATCIESIGAGGTELFPSTLTPLSISPSKNQIFSVNTAAANTASFSFYFSPTSAITSTSINVTAYQRVGDKLVELGGVAFSDLVATFTKDFGIGEFFLCIRSKQSYTGTIVGTFAGYAGEARFVPAGSDGATMTVVIENKRPPVACDEPIYYELIEGSLPPGLTLSGLGRIAGVLPNLDCLTDAVEYSPAMNWSYADTANRMSAWGRTWRFKIRITLGAGQEDANDVEWFCVRVHNNWSLDRDNFLAQAPFKEIREIEIIEEPTPLPRTMCEPCPEEDDSANWAPKEIAEVGCQGCDSADLVTDVQLIEIPKELAHIEPNEWVTWWLLNRDKDWACTALERFVKGLGASAYFQSLLSQAGVGSVPDDPRVLIEVAAFDKFLQLSASTLIDGRGADDIDYQMMVWKAAVNQKLPIMAIANFGQSMEVHLA